MTEETVSELCCPPDCCDMRGFLTFQILWEMTQGPLNGQEVAKRIAKRRGTKPTPGTIYPALRDLKEGKLIKVIKTEGRQVVYELTEAGRQGFDEAARYFYQAFGDILAECKVIVQRVGDCSGC